MNNDAVIASIREAKELAQRACQSINEYADSIHKGSTENISVNAGALDEIGQAISDLSDSIDDIASTVSSLDERLNKLEGNK